MEPSGWEVIGVFGMLDFDTQAKTVKGMRFAFVAEGRYLWWGTLVAGGGGHLLSTLSKQDKILQDGPILV